MKRNMHLFDVSNYIFAGTREDGPIICRGIIEDQSSYRSKEMLVGGISFMLNALHEFDPFTDELVFCIDMPPTFKRNLHSSSFPLMDGYKANRAKPHPSIKYQKLMVEEVLKQCGCNVISVEDYESDDILASIVEYYKSSYEKIYIHTKDSDLQYLVCSNVYIDKVGASGKFISLENWEYTVKKDYITPYNTVTINKMICNDGHDNIPAVTSGIEAKLLSGIKESDYPKCGDLKWLREKIKEVTNDDYRTLSIFDLIVPVILPKDKVEIFDTCFDKETFIYYAAMLGNKYYKKHKPAFNALADETIERYLNLYTGDS